MNLAGLFATLAPFKPTLVGTFPLGLQVEGSDLDVLCEASPEAFERVLPGTRKGDVCIARFELAGLPVEVFAQPVPVNEQVAFRHMIVEGRLLALFPSLRDEVLARKRAGVKTEPAFAQALGMEGDPYQAVLSLEPLSERELCARFPGRLPRT